MKKTTVMAIALDLLKNNVTALVICLIIGLSFAGLVDEFLIAKIIVQVLNLFVVSVLTYIVGWKMGSRHRNKVDQKLYDEKKDYKKGFLAGLLAIVPFVITDILLICFSFYNNTAFIPIYKVLNGQYIVLINEIIVESSYSFISVWSVAALLAIKLFVPIVSGAAFILGFKRISLKVAAIYK